MTDMLWTKLGFDGGALVNGTFFNETECYVQGLLLNPMAASAWNNLGATGGGVVDGIDYNERECFQKALEADPAHASAWKNLASRGGGSVSGKDYDESHCLAQARALQQWRGLPAPVRHTAPRVTYHRYASPSYERRVVRACAPDKVWHTPIYFEKLTPGTVRYVSVVRDSSHDEASKHFQYSDHGHEGVSLDRIDGAFVPSSSEN